MPVQRLSCHLSLERVVFDLIFLVACLLLFCLDLRSFVLCFGTAGLFFVLDATYQWRMELRPRFPGDGCSPFFSRKTRPDLVYQYFFDPFTPSLCGVDTRSFGFVWCRALLLGVSL